MLLTFAVHPSIHTLHWRDFPHLKEATRFLYCWDFSYSEAAITSIHPHTLLMGFSPLWGGYKIPPLLDFFHSEIICVHSADEIFPSEVLTQHAYRLFLDRPTGVETFAVGFFPLGVPTLLQEFFSLRAPVWCSTDEFFSSRSTNTSPPAFSSEPMRRWTPDNFSLSGSFHPYSDVGNTILL